MPELRQGTYRPCFPINAPRALGHAGSLLGGKQDTNAGFKNQPEPPLRRASPSFKALHLHASSLGRGTAETPHAAMTEPEEHGGDVQQRAEDKESPETRLSREDGSDESTFVVGAHLPGPSGELPAALWVCLSFTPVHVTVPKQSSSLVWSAPCVARSPSPAL